MSTRHLLHGHSGADDDDWHPDVVEEENSAWITSLSPIRIHGILMIVGWLFCINVGSMVARYLKKASQPYPQWFPIHVWLQSIGAVLSVVAFILVISHLIYEGSQHFNGFHQVFGLGLTLILFFQIYLGTAAHYSWYEGKPTSPIDMWHWWFGRFAIIGAMFECLLGIDIFSKDGASVTPVLWLFAVGIVIFSFFGLAAYEIHYKSGSFPVRLWKGGDLDEDEPSDSKYDLKMNEFRFVVFYGLICAILVSATTIGLFFA